MNANTLLPKIDCARAFWLVLLALCGAGCAANRGADSLRPGENKMEAFQHLAIVFDGTIESLPFIDFQQAPDGIDGRAGVQIQGELTLDRVRQIAAMLSSGPLPATLEPAGP